MILYYYNSINILYYIIAYLSNDECASRISRFKQLSNIICYNEIFFCYVESF